MMIYLFFLGLIASASLQGTSAFSPAPRLQQQRTAAEVISTTMDMKAPSSDVDRRTVLTTAAAALLLGAAPSSSLALDTIPADNEIIKEQRTVTDKLDINNAPVADYMQFPGMYPTIGGKIATNAPYKSLKEVYKLNNLSAAEKSKIKEYESELTATASKGLDTMRGRDPYRRSFNK
jgi:hypothetical protein